jgi:hypothetical protein
MDWNDSPHGIKQRTIEKENDEFVMRHHNRIKKTAPKGATQKHWCNHCDAQQIRIGERCPKCKQKDISKHQKP